MNFDIFSPYYFQVSNPRRVKSWEILVECRGDKNDIAYCNISSTWNPCHVKQYIQFWQVPPRKIMHHTADSLNNTPLLYYSVVSKLSFTRNPYMLHLLQGEARPNYTLPLSLATIVRLPNLTEGPTCFLARTKLKMPHNRGWSCLWLLILSLIHIINT